MTVYLIIYQQDNGSFSNHRFDYFTRGIVSTEEFAQNYCQKNNKGLLLHRYFYEAYEIDEILNSN